MRVSVFPRSTVRLASLIALLVCLGAGRLFAAVQLASPFTSHMVLQRELPVPVWGSAEPGEQVVVDFAGQQHRTQASPDGRWRVTLAPLPASGEARVFTVTGSRTAQPLMLDDVLVGEVWLASGQSNMDFTVARTEKYYFCGVTNEAEEIAAAQHPRIRMFTGEWQKAYEPQPRVAGAWQVCTPETVREFSAVGYFFARAVQRDLEVPVGIVTLTFGASCAQAWLRRDAMTGDPRLADQLAQFDAEVAAFRTDPTVQEKHTAAVAQWEVAAAQARAEGKRPPRRPRHPDPVQDQHNPTVMFNGMIAPVVPYAVRGFLWYQGESITAPRELFPVWNETLIRDWRALWGAELPFFFVQLAAHRANSNSPAVRELQTAALALPRTGMAVTIDIGDRDDVHPKNKQDVGARLARLALAKVYGRDVVWSGPAFAGSIRDGDALRLRFTHTDGGLVARDGATLLNCFEIAAATGDFVPAEARLDGDMVVVRSAAITEPARARYAWTNFPENPNLANGAGLPAAPFRTDGPVAAASSVTPR